MDVADQHVLVTGGAGFIGSHLVERLRSVGASVTIVDNLSSGRRKWVPPDETVIDWDLTNPGGLVEEVAESVDTVYHLASRTAVDDPHPLDQFTDNCAMARNLIDELPGLGDPDIVFTSTSTVYGDAPRPTPEDFAPLQPISMYGASKLACEAMFSVIAQQGQSSVLIFRFANVVGPRLRGAVIPDFIEKLLADPNKLEILGNGQQRKSYIHVDDCIEAMLTIQDRTSAQISAVNLGTRTSTSVDRIAEIVISELGVDPDISYTGGKTGWLGDVSQMRLSIEKASALGWRPAHSSERAVERATKQLCEELQPAPG